ncbi:DUF1064 domain-containing protein [Sporosarcina sp. FSL K6-1522]|uniref:DUF1064 domain-containing protein n=1 Tax=Sporosarcina sp. FSL K6-1522 TaxID=2921554 RepID=UPI00315A6641
MRNAQRVSNRQRAPKQSREFISKTITLDGINFDSKTEGLYYMHLKKDQFIKQIEVQPEFQIIEPYKVSCKRCYGLGNRPSPKTGNPIKCTLCRGKGERWKSGAIYTADFRVTYFDGFVEVIDIKGGPVTRDFPLRRKLFEMKTGMELIVVRLKNKEWVRE